MSSRKEFEEIFSRAQSELTQQQFYTWITQAYGVITTDIEGEPEINKRCNLKVLNNIIDMVKCEDNLFCALCGNKIRGVHDDSM